MQASYIRAMDAIHRACLVVCGVCLAVIAIIIPWGVFTRYALNSAASWPEPLAVLLMIVLAFLSAVVCYREYLHIGVGIIPGLLHGPAKVALGVVIELCMAATNVFMLWWGISLVQTTWYQTIGEFPVVTVGMSYLPVPIAGLLTLLFVIERLWTGALFPAEPEDATATVSLE
ncbi:TRAP transporter small permease [Enterovirga aerilata]|uniref:TRAP transporter small permease protein n=1 Tax=Enterovirga aerilata TaxID=2730920 RepID=A0A849IBE1_9HYPH|nr:TRAP transporter small permease [Enterovirga sp. DB1703]NNM73360.1 TRAP transporter small permease [Enterovirga sp. DB1703]